MKLTSDELRLAVQAVDADLAGVLRYALMSGAVLDLRPETARAVAEAVRDGVLRGVYAETDLPAVLQLYDRKLAYNVRLGLIETG